MIIVQHETYEGENKVTYELVLVKKETGTNWKVARVNGIPSFCCLSAFIEMLEQEVAAQEFRKRAIGR